MEAVLNSFWEQALSLLLAPGGQWRLESLSGYRLHNGLNSEAKARVRKHLISALETDQGKGSVYRSTTGKKPIWAYVSRCSAWVGQWISESSMVYLLGLVISQPVRHQSSRLLWSCGVWSWYSIGSSCVTLWGLSGTKGGTSQAKRDILQLGGLQVISRLAHQARALRKRVPSLCVLMWLAVSGR